MPELWRTAAGPDRQLCRLVLLQPGQAGPKNQWWKLLGDPVNQLVLFRQFKLCPPNYLSNFVVFVWLRSSLLQNVLNWKFDTPSVRALWGRQLGGVTTHKLHRSSGLSWTSGGGEWSILGRIWVFLPLHRSKRNHFIFNSLEPETAVAARTTSLRTAFKLCLTASPTLFH